MAPIVRARWPSTTTDPNQWIVTTGTILTVRTHHSGFPKLQANSLRTGNRNRGCLLNAPKRYSVVNIR